MGDASLPSPLWRSPWFCVTELRTNIDHTYWIRTDLNFLSPALKPFHSRSFIAQTLDPSLSSFGAATPAPQAILSSRTRAVEAAAAARRSAESARWLAGLARWFLCTAGVTAAACPPAGHSRGRQLLRGGGCVGCAPFLLLLLPLLLTPLVSLVLLSR